MASWVAMRSTDCNNGSVMVTAGSHTSHLLTLRLSCYYYHYYYRFILVVDEVSTRTENGDVVRFRLERLTSFPSFAGRCYRNSQPYVPLRFRVVGGRVRHRFLSAPVRAVAQTEPQSSLVHRISVRHICRFHVIVKQSLIFQQSAGSVHKSANQ